MTLPKKTQMTSTRKERRAKFDKWIDKDFIRSQWLSGKIKSLPFYGDGTGEVRLPKTMSNADRRRLGIEQDEALEDYIPDNKPEQNDKEGNQKPGLIVEPGSEDIGKEQV